MMHVWTTYRQLLRDTTINSFVHLFSGEHVENGDEELGAIFNVLVEHAELGAGPLVGDAWQNYLLDRLLHDANPFSKKAAAGGGVSALGRSLQNATVSDLEALETLYRQGTRTISERASTSRDILSEQFPRWDEVLPLSPSREPATDLLFRNVLRMKQLLDETPGWGQLLPELGEFHARFAYGSWLRALAFRWNGTRLEAVSYPAISDWNELVGYERQKTALSANTEKLLRSLPASNVLLYGDRGTGKSSTIKGLLPRYGERGLRLVELPKRFLGDLAVVSRSLHAIPLKFIVFIDDLSFEEHETEYKELKVLLEGGLESQPANTAIYATSNRRHLVTERHSDRNGNALDSEVNPLETVEEKLSLADRFGLSIFFPTPNQAQYLNIVHGLAERRSLDIDDDELDRRALQWQSSHNGKSGRTARQFIDSLVTE